MAKTDTSACDGLHRQGIALAEKDEGSTRAGVGRPEVASGATQAAAILTQDGVRVEVFCEGFDTQKKGPLK